MAHLEMAVGNGVGIGNRGSTRPALQRRHRPAPAPFTCRLQPPASGSFHAKSASWCFGIRKGTCKSKPRPAILGSSFLLRIVEEVSRQSRTTSRFLGTYITCTWHNVTQYALWPLVTNRMSAPSRVTHNNFSNKIIVSASLESKRHCRPRRIIRAPAKPTVLVVDEQQDEPSKPESGRSKHSDSRPSQTLSASSREPWRRQQSPGGVGVGTRKTYCQVTNGWNSLPCQCFASPATP